MARCRPVERLVDQARDVSALQDLRAEYPGLLALSLDVTDANAVRDRVGEAEEHFGRLDVVVNNAGYGHFGAVEEVTDAELRDELETNVFGAHRVVRAALPEMRQRRIGHIIQVSSIGGVMAVPNMGAYHASKWALEALSESLRPAPEGVDRVGGPGGPRIRVIAASRRP